MENTKMTELSCNEFAEILASKEPVPGGGGASAMAGALGAALGQMVAGLTVGKKTYAAVEDEIRTLASRAEVIRNRLLELVDEDAVHFKPLADSYSLPRSTEEERMHREKVMEAALKEACFVPLEIVRLCGEAVRLCAEFAKKGSKLAVSDAGAGSALCRSAMYASSLNIFINTRLMKDREYAKKLNDDTLALLSSGYDVDNVTQEFVLSALDVPNADRRNDGEDN